MKTEIAKATEITKKKGGWAKLDRAVIEDTTLCKTAIALYGLLREMVDFDTDITYPVSYSTLGEKLGRTARTAYTHMRTMIDKGIVIPIPNFTIRKGKKVYDKNSYRVIGGDAPCYQSPEYSSVNSPNTEEYDKKFQRGNEENYETNTPEAIIRDIRTKETNIREAETSSVVFSSPSYVTPEAPSEAPKVCEAPAKKPSETDCGKPEVQSPKQKTISKAKTVKPETAPKAYDLSGLPDILHPTAIFYLSQTGRTELTEKDKQILCELLEEPLPRTDTGRNPSQAGGIHGGTWPNPRAN